MQYADPHPTASPPPSGAAARPPLKQSTGLFSGRSGPPSGKAYGVPPADRAESFGLERSAQRTVPCAMLNPLRLLVYCLFQT